MSAGRRTKKELLGICSKLSESLCKLYVKFGSVGAFGESVIFCSPVADNALLSYCDVVNKGFWKFRPADGGNYLPENWVPHITLGCKLKGELIIRAFEFITDNFSSFEVIVDRLTFARCAPYKESVIFELETGVVKNERTNT